MILTFMGEIPLDYNREMVLNFKIFSMQKTDFYFWGFIYENHGFTHINRPFPMNIPAFLIWISIISVGVSMIMASTKKATEENSMRLFVISFVIVIILTIFYGINILIAFLYEFKPFYEIVGLGYYLLVGIFILNAIALKILKDDSMLDIKDLFPFL